MKFNEAGLALLKEFEGCKLEVYKDIVGLNTVGYGHRTNLPLGHKITQDEADTLLKQDLTKFEDGVSDLVNVSLNDNQYSALVCLAYNIGLGNFQRSGIRKEINCGELEEAATRFVLWASAGGRKVEGLVRRREAERDLFLKPMEEPKDASV